MIDDIGKDVAFKVIDADDRDVPGLRKRFGSHHADKQRAHQSGTASDSDQAEFFSRIADAGLGQRFAGERQNSLKMHPRGVFGDDAAECRVTLRLAGYVPAQDRAGAFEHRDRCVVTAAFDSQRQETF